MKKAGRPKAKPDVAKTDYIEIRCAESEKEAFRSAAEAAGMPLSGWIRDRLRKSARKELEDLDKPVPFLDRLTA